MKIQRRTWAVIAMLVLMIGVVGAGLVAAQGNDRDSAEDLTEGADVAITGDALDQASATALEFTGEGRVTDTEVGDEEGYYEVEVTLDNGRQVDVHLDENFRVLGQEGDSDTSDD